MKRERERERGDVGEAVNFLACIAMEAKEPRESALVLYRLVEKLRVRVRSARVGELAQKPRQPSNARRQEVG